MTFSELYHYKDLQADIRDLTAELEAISFLKAVDYSGMPHGTGVGDPTSALVMQRDKLVDKLTAKKMESLAEMNRIEEYIDTIPDLELQTLFREHFILLMTYEAIGNAHNYDRTTIAKKIRRYLKDSHNSRS